MEDSILKMSIVHKTVYRFNAISIKVSIPYFLEIEKYMLKFICNLKGPQIAKTILRKKSWRLQTS